jgi:hypothetical protein
MSGVSFERLPPERRIAAPSAASAGSCCCCCCCCLHTVGSIVGALTGKAPKLPENVAAVPTAVAGGVDVAPNYKVTKEYWVTLLILCTVGLPILMFATDTRIDRPGEWLLLYAIVLPGIQLAASVIVGLRNTWSKRPGKQERIAHLGSITVRAFIGGLLGILVMVVMFGLR